MSYTFLAWSAKAAPWGSLAFTTQSPPDPHRAIQDRPTACLDPFGRRIEVRHPEIDHPVRRHVGHFWRLVHHAANHSVRPVEHVYLPVGPRSAVSPGCQLKTSL